MAVAGITPMNQVFRWPEIEDIWLLEESPPSNNRSAVIRADINVGWNAAYVKTYRDTLEIFSVHCRAMLY